MKQPDLEEEALRLARARHATSRCAARRMADEVAQVTVTTPTGQTRTLTLDKAEPGVWKAVTQANELGLWRATDGKLTALVNVGPANPREYAEVTSSTNVLAPLASATGGDARRIADASGNLTIPRVLGGALDRHLQGRRLARPEDARRQRGARHRRAAAVRRPARAAAADRLARGDVDARGAVTRRVTPRAVAAHASAAAARA